MPEWILAVLGLVITAGFFFLESFSLYNFFRFFRGKKTPVEQFIEQQERRKSELDNKN